MITAEAVYLYFIHTWWSALESWYGCEMDINEHSDTFDILNKNSGK